MVYSFGHPPYSTFHSKNTASGVGTSVEGWPYDRGGVLLAEKPSTTMKKTIAALAAALFLFPSVSSAAGLTYQQASSIIVLLESFGVNSATITQVWGYIAPPDTPLSPPTIATTQATSPSFGGTIVVNPQPIPSMSEQNAPVLPQMTQVAPVIAVPIQKTTTVDVVPAQDTPQMPNIGTFSVQLDNPNIGANISSLNLCAITASGQGIQNAMLYKNGFSVSSTSIDLPECNQTPSGVSITASLDQLNGPAELYVRGTPDATSTQIAIVGATITYPDGSTTSQTMNVLSQPLAQ